MTLLQGKAILKASSKRQLATAEQIRRDYEAIEPLSLNSTGNASEDAKLYEPFTAIVISRTNAIEIAREFVDNWISRLMRGRHYPDFDKSPRTAQMALVDILYSKGFNGFIAEFKKFRMAYNRRDWAKAAGESSREQNPGRNAIVKNFLLDNVAAEPFFIDARGRTISIDELD